MESKKSYNSITIVSNGVEYDGIPPFQATNPKYNYSGIHSAIVMAYDGTSEYFVTYKKHTFKVILTRPDSEKLMLERIKARLEKVEAKIAEAKKREGRGYGHGK